MITTRLCEICEIRRLTLVFLPSSVSSTMPRYKKGCIGRRSKRSGTKSKSVDQQSTIRDSASPTTLHDNTTCLRGILDDNIVRQLQWDEAWAAFYTSPAEHYQEAVASESHSHGASTDSDNCSADAFYVLVGKMYQYNPDDNLAGRCCHWHTASQKIPTILMFEKYFI